MIDSHCHLEFSQFDSERDKVIEKSMRRIKAVVDSCASIDDMDKVMEISRGYENFVFPCLGLQPTGAVEADESTVQRYMDRIRKSVDEIVGIGEVGLDYHHINDEEKRERSKEVFSDFIELSDELDLPVVIHTRDAMEDTFNILEDKEGKVLIHSFSGNPEDLRTAMDKGYYISLGGIIFRSRERYRKIIKEVDMDRVLLETDAPFLAKRKEDKSYPWFIREVAERISEIRNMGFDTVWEVTGKNASEFYDLPIDI